MGDSSRRPRMASSNIESPPAVVGVVAATSRHLGELYRADIYGATSVRRLGRWRRFVAGHAELGDGGVDALDGAVTGEGDGSTAEVTGDTGPQGQRAGSHRIAGRVDAEVRAVRLDVLLLQTDRLGHAAQDADGGLDVEGAEIDEHVVGILGGGRGVVEPAAVGVTELPSLVTGIRPGQHGVFGVDRQAVTHGVAEPLTHLLEQSVETTERLQLLRWGDHLRRDAVGLGAGVRGEAQR